MWALSDGPLLSSILVKSSHSTNKQSHTYFSEDMSSVFPSCLQNSEFFSEIFRNMATFPLCCTLLLWEDCLLWSLKRKNIFFDSEGHMKHNVRNFFLYGLRSERSFVFWTQFCTNRFYPSWTHQEVKAPPFHWWFCSTGQFPCCLKMWDFFCFDLTFLSFILGFTFQSLVLVTPFFTQLKISLENNAIEKSKNAF